MISYLREQPRTQALADALRGTAAANGGTQMPQGTSSFVGNTKIPEADFQQYGSGKGSAQSGMNDFAKKGWDMFKNSETGKGWMDSISGMFGGTPSATSSAGWMDGAGAFGGPGASIGGSGSSAAGSGMGSMASSAGPIAAIVAAGLATDQLLNESDKGKWYNADKLNSYGTFEVGGKDIGLRGGDLANGLNPATWLSDPNKAQKGLFNAMTLGIFD